MTVAGPDPVGVVLFEARLGCWGVIEMGDRDLVRGELGDAFDGSASAEDVEGVKDGGAPGVTRFLEDIESGFDGAVVLDEAEELEGRQAAFMGAEVEQFAIAAGTEVEVGGAGRRACDHMRGAEDGGLSEASHAVVANRRPLGVGAIEPIADVDDGGHLEAGVIEGASDFEERSAGDEVGIDVGEPEFDGLKAGLGGNFDLAEDRGPTNRGRIEA